MKIKIKQQEILQQLNTSDGEGHAKLNATKWIKKSTKHNNTQKDFTLNLEYSDDNIPVNQNKEPSSKILQCSIIFN